MLVFLTQLCEQLPLTYSLWLALPLPPLPCVNKYTVYKYTVCKGGGLWRHRRGGGPQTDKTTAAKSLYRSIVLANDIWHCFLY
jgi:hypothetical protein